MCSRLKILVCQHGARHRYAIPRMLESAGLLSAFYTDSSSESFLGKISTFFGKFVSLSLRRLTQRKITGVPGNKIRSSDTSAFHELFNAVVKRRHLTEIELFLERHRLLSEKMKQWGIGDANVIYSMYYENLDFLEFARSKGCKSIVDVYANPLMDEIMLKEENPFGFSNEFYDSNVAKKKLSLWQRTATLADILLCPSEWVAEGVRKVSPENAHKISVVPYGCSINYSGTVNQPKPGKVLFAGNNALLKGIHYLANAATELRSIDKDIEIQVAGLIPDTITSHPICKDLSFLGKLSSDQMKERFLTSDIFVLPTLSEGFAGVVAEAICAGCPVIVTREAGSPVIHEREGLIVPSRDSNALSRAILRIVKDRKLREACARNCIEQIPFYTESSWSERLTQTLSNRLCVKC